MVKFAFLGTCGAVQHRNLDNSSLLLSYEDKGFLIDVGGGIVGKFKRLEFDVHKLHGAIITHAHVDHIYGLPSLIHQMWLLGRTDPFYIYGLADVLELSRSLIDLFELKSKRNMFQIILQPISQHQPIDEKDGLSISCQEVEHGVPAVAIRVMVDGQPVLLYSGDTAFDANLVEFARGSKVVLHEASTLDELREETRRKGHTTAKEAGIFAELAGAEQLYLFHFDAMYENKTTKLKDEAALEFGRKIIIPKELKWYSC